MPQIKIVNTKHLPTKGLGNIFGKPRLPYEKETLWRARILEYLEIATFEVYNFDKLQIEALTGLDMEPGEAYDIYFKRCVDKLINWSWEAESTKVPQEVIEEAIKVIRGKFAEAKIKILAVRISPTLPALKNLINSYNKHFSSDKWLMFNIYTLKIEYAYSQPLVKDEFRAKYVDPQQNEWTLKVNTGNSFDEVNRPAHYTSSSIEVIDAIEAWELDFKCGNAVKYIARAGKKDPNKELQDLEKAQWYLTRKINQIKKLVPVVLLCFALFSCEKRTSKVEEPDVNELEKIERLYFNFWTFAIYKIQKDSIEYLIVNDGNGISITKHQDLHKNKKP